VNDSPLFTRLLIANRGEIAVRVIRACREMGIESIAVYSEADANAFHTTIADRAMPIGPAAAADSYLSVEAIMNAARASGAQAVHPGYGFLSENPSLPAACQDAGIAFIGPPADVIDRMGAKIAARSVAKAAGVPVVPGETPADQSDAAIIAAATRIGFPLLLKPSEGGGGIGMKAVRDAASLEAAIAQAQREAFAAFGDGTLYIERLIEKPRHVEFQILADHHGHIVHVFERECSVQRRHQKVIEESPSTALTPALRKRMGDAAVAVARTARYRNAGTVEFLLEGTGDSAQFYFLEMNTRLQVEHPVTEQVTGVDLVRAQIAVASGQPLPWPREVLSQRGHAIEVRVYAEDPARNDLPQAGRLLLYREPSMPGIRVDAGVIEGSEVSVHYDPLLAKLIAWGENREAARRRALAALRSYPVLGIRTNIGLLIELLEHPRLVAGEIDTRFLDSEGDAIRARLRGDPPAAVHAVAAAARTNREPGTRNLEPGTRNLELDPWTSLRGARV
jgi:acetyl/propionyl-CoA carboxylase alpha subunit